MSGGHLVITVIERPGNRQEIEEFIRHANENLDRLREEVRRYKGQVLEAVKSAAQRRIKEVQEQKEQDDALGFPVERD